MESTDPFFLNFSPFLLNARQKPLITTGTTTGRVCFIMKAVPFRAGAKGLVVPWGNVITQLFCNARVTFRVSDGSRPRRTSFPSLLHVRLTVSAPANEKNRLTQLPFIVSSAAT